MCVTILSFLLFIIRYTAKKHDKEMRKNGWIKKRCWHKDGTWSYYWDKEPSEPRPENPPPSGSHL